MGQFARAVAGTFAANIVRVALRLGTSVLVARSLGVEGQGEYALAILLATLMSSLADLGVTPSTTYYVSSEQFPLDRIAGNTLAFSLVSSALAVLVGLGAIVAFRTTFFGSISTEGLALTLALVPVSIFFAYFEGILLGLRAFRHYNGALVITDGLTLALSFVAVMLLRMGVVGALAAQVLTGAATCLLVYWWVRRAAGRIKIEFNLAYFRSTFLYSIKAHVANVLGLLTYRVDMLFVNAFLGVTGVGFYSVAGGVAEKLGLISQAAAIVLFPNVAAETNEQARREFTPRVARTVFWLSALAALPVFFFSNFIVTLFYSPTFLEAGRLIQILLPGLVALSVSTVLNNDVAGRGRPALNAWVALASITINIALDLLMIPPFGVEGAAWACTLAYLAKVVMSTFIYCRLSGNPALRMLVPA